MLIVVAFLFAKLIKFCGNNERYLYNSCYFEKIMYICKNIIEFLKMIRDKQLDNYRALVMIHMVCVIHVIYWLGNFFPMQSLTLFAMSSVFFISGAAMKYSHPKSNASLLLNRFKRVLLPYYIYACLCVCILICVCVIPKLSVFTKFSILHYSIKDFLEILFVQGIPGIKMVYHIWFIIPYLIITCSFNYQKQIINKYSWKYVLINILVIAALYFLKVYDVDYKSFTYIQSVFYDTSLNVLAYNVFFVIGYLYYKKITTHKLFTICLVSFLLFLFFTGFSLPDLQIHKNPPDIIFVLYNIGIICLLGILFSKITIPDNHLLKWWNNNGYTIYLYQNLVFVIYQRFFFYHLCSYVYNVYVRIIVSFFMLFVGTMIISIFSVTIEKYIFKIFYSKNNNIHVQD